MHTHIAFLFVIILPIPINNMITMLLSLLHNTNTRPSFRLRSAPRTSCTEPYDEQQHGPRLSPHQSEESCGVLRRDFLAVYLNQRHGAPPCGSRTAPIQAAGAPKRPADARRHCLALSHSPRRDSIKNVEPKSVPHNCRRRRRETAGNAQWRKLHSGFEEQ